MADYTSTASAIIAAVGGKENISNLVHCVTRLRFNLHDKDKCAPVEEIGAIEGTLGATWAGQQLQIIIGPAVADAYAAVCKQASIDQQAAIDENLDADLIDGDKKKGFHPSVIFDVFTGVFAPIVPAFAGAGIIKGVLTLLSTYGIMSTDAGVYILLNAIGDAVFNFLPFIIAFTAARGCGRFLGQA